MFSKNLLISLTTLIFIAIVGVATVKILANAQSAPNLYATFGANKNEVVPGDTLEYVLTVRNDGTETLNNVLVREHFMDGVTLVAGSTRAEKNGTTITVPDNWSTTTFNFGTLTPGQTAYFKYIGQIPASATVGSEVENAIDTKADGIADWIGRAHTVQVVSANQTAELRDGNFLNITNVNLQNGWHTDGVNANIGQTVEFLVYIRNDGDNDARNVHLKANLPSTNATILHPSVTLSADNASSVTDDVFVNLNSPGHLEYRFGHARLFGNTELYNCPNGCDIPQSFYHTAMNLGTVRPGESATIQVIFKADVVGEPVAEIVCRPQELQTVSVNQSVSFNVVSTGRDPNNVVWTAASGSPASGTGLTFTTQYSAPGDYQVSVTDGGPVTSCPVRIVATPTNTPTATPTATPTSTPTSTPTNNPTATPTVVPSPVLGTVAPQALPKTGNEGIVFVAASIASIGAGIYLFRRFKLA